MIKWNGQSSNRASAVLARAARLLCFVAALSACDDGSSPSKDGSTDPSTESDAEAEDAEAEETGPVPDDDASPPDGDVGTAADGGMAAIDVAAPLPGTPCESADDCDDGIFCNGKEICEPATGGDQTVCKPGIPPECTRDHPCLEAQRTCDCTNPDLDNDGDGAEICIGNPTQRRLVEHYKDCDDDDGTRCSTKRELCDTQDFDEDCDAKTFGERDQDGDGYKDATCRNWDKQGKPHGGDDCNDHDPKFHPKAQEICDYFDNNCNGYVDEKRLPPGSAEEYEKKDGGQRELLLPDRDRDGHGQGGVDPTLLCNVTEKEGLVVATASKDCDDTNPHTYEGAPEICDGLDNDCDGKVDADDVKDANSDGLQTKYSFTATTVSCVGGQWMIPEGGCPSRDVQWCDGLDPIEQGCRSDATRLGSCRACQTDCKFSCGQEGCDEVADLAAGTFHACSITEVGRVACWGRGALGRLGNESSTNAAVPQPVDGMPKAVALAAGLSHSCAIAGTDRALYCWGDDAAGQLGSDEAIGAAGYSSTPLQVAGGTVLFDPTTFEFPLFLTGVVSVATGTAHTCAALASGHLGCWGEQASGRLGNDELTSGAVTIPSAVVDEERMPVTNAAEVSVGDAHGCARANDGKVSCWGDNRFGQLGRDPQQIARSAIASAVPALDSATSLSAGLAHVCVVSLGKVFCWGENKRLQLGRPSNSPVPGHVPHAVPGLENIVSVDCGANHCCALGSGSALSCWGNNESGQLGRAASADSAEPSLVPLQNVVAMAVGDRFTCAMSEAHNVYCWGDASFGRLANGTISVNSYPSPQPIRSLAGSKP